jgi:gliding motility-associated lipoprotein GldH
MTSCKDNSIFDENTNIPSKTWNRHNLVKLNVPITDTVNSFRIFINIRNDGNYSRRNIFLFITVRSPKGDELKDTVNCILADEKGRWYGKSNLGDLYFNRFLYKPKVIFPHAGNYTFIIEQAMRTENLDNIEDVGVRIEKFE